jgi:hypothetical protein
LVGGIDLKFKESDGQLAFEVRFETPSGDQAPRWLYDRRWHHCYMQTVLRCHMAAFDAIGGVPEEILYDRMKTAVIGEGGGRLSCGALLATWSSEPKSGSLRTSEQNPLGFLMSFSCGLSPCARHIRWTLL